MCYIEQIMKKSTTIVAAICALVGLMAAESNVAQQEYRSFQLVYHSDNRGYIRPCG
jgi:hypothetical protein